MMLDHISKLLPVYAFVPKAAVTDNTAQVSSILDLLGCGSASLVYGMGTNADADATFTLLVEESDASDMTGATAVADADLIGSEALASFDFADDGLAYWIGYKGSKRYIRATLTPANNTGNLFLGGFWLKGHLDQAPAVRN